MNQVVVSFLLDIYREKFAQVKPQLIEACRKLQSDDVGYFYIPEGMYPLKPGGMVAAIANHKQYIDPYIGDAMRQIITAMSYEDLDCKKYVFVISDHFSTTGEFKIKAAMNLEHKEDHNCDFIFINLAGSGGRFLKPLCEKYDNSSYVETTPDKLTDLITEIYKQETDGTFHTPIDMDDLREGLGGIDE